MDGDPCPVRLRSQKMRHWRRVSNFSWIQYQYWPTWVIWFAPWRRCGRRRAAQHFASQAARGPGLGPLAIGFHSGH